MDLEKGIRAQSIRPYPSGYWEPPTASHWEKTILDTSKQYLRTDEDIESWSWPEEVCLRVLWRRSELEVRSTTAQIVTSSDQYNPCNFYDPHSSDNPEFAKQASCKAVELIYQGTGSYYLHGQSHIVQGYKCEVGQLDINPDGLMYKKIFRVQNAGELIVRRYRLNATSWLVTPPLRPDKAALNLVPLLSYGGYCKPSSALSDIEQVYARITYQGQQTSLELKSQSYLTEKGIAPPQGGTIGRNLYCAVEDISKDETLSLGGNLQSGCVKLKIINHGESRIYSSVSYRQKDLKSQVFDLTFIPQQ
ncbi:MAG: hypothetical protein IBJ00_02475 [Alphaproteobacteria bacterium]|nr:hypothetical protein [Alphaproteobacteria bacterium]